MLFVRSSIRYPWIVLRQRPLPLLLWPSRALRAADPASIQRVQLCRKQTQLELMGLGDLQGSQVSSQKDSHAAFSEDNNFPYSYDKLKPTSALGSFFLFHQRLFDLGPLLLSSPLQFLSHSAETWCIDGITEYCN